MDRSEHFERIAPAYDGARPPYPSALFGVLREAGAIGPGTTVLEIGAGTGLATRDLVAAGGEVVALEPGFELGRLLRRALPDVSVLTTRLEDADLPVAAYDTVAAATSLHWVDLDVALPRLHAALRPGGRLAVWRHCFGDDEAEVTPFRRQVLDGIAARAEREEQRPEERPTLDELAAGGVFVPVRSEHWRWSVDLTAAQVRALFGTFSNWSEAEVEMAGRAAEELGGVVTEHYRTWLHLLRRA